MCSQINLRVERWAAWAPGIEAPEEWESWARGERDFGPLDAAPSVAFIKPMARRRLSRLSRMALSVAHACAHAGEGEGAGDLAYVFCSRYGEYERTMEALKALAEGEPMSPAVFSQSVHNTSAGHFTIINKDRSPVTTIAANDATLEAGMLEASMLLADERYRRVMVVYHDEPLNEIYGNPHPSFNLPLAAAFMLTSGAGASSSLPHLTLSWAPARAGDKAGHREEEHPVLKVLRLVLGRADEASVPAGRLTWEWRRHDG